MPSNISLISSKNKELHNRLIILEKFIELKSNECAYYRTKVHLMQMSPIPSQIITNQENNHNNTSEDSSQSSITSQSQLNNRHRRSSVPLSSQQKSILKQTKFSPNCSRSKKNLSASPIPFEQSKKSKHVPFSSSTRRNRNERTYSQNQNYYEEVPLHSKPSNHNISSSTKDNHELPQNLLNQILVSYVNKHIQQVIAHDKNIQCNDNDFHQIEPASKSPHTVLMIRLPRRFVKSLVEQQQKTTRPKLKVQISSELLNKLLQSINTKNTNHQLDKFTIQSQFGTIAACINHEESKAVHAKVEVKTHRLPKIRHIARTGSDDSIKKKIISEKNLHKHWHYRRKKRHLHKSNSTSHEEIFSKRSSLTNVTQSSNNDSSDQASNSVSVEK